MNGDEVERLRRELEERDELLAYLAHELRNPLHAIGLLASSARSSAERAGALQAATRITNLERSIHRFNERATSLLDLARVATSGMSSVVLSVDLGIAIEKLIASYLDEAAASRAELVSGPMVEGVVAEIEPRLIEHVVGNLIGNAMKHAGASRITVSLERSAQTRHALISVADNGRGIPASERKSIFTKFEKTSTGNSSSSGSGLGLWIAQKLAHAVHGTISLDCTPGSGSRFLFEFPLTPAPLRRS